MKSTTVADISQCLLNKARTEQFAGYDPLMGSIQAGSSAYR